MSANRRLSSDHRAAARVVERLGPRSDRVATDSTTARLR